MRERILFIYLIAALVGVVTGFVGSYFQVAIELCNRWMLKGIEFARVYGWSPLLISVILSLIMAYIAWLMVKKLAPEAAGSGVQEIEGTLLHERPIFWPRLIPVKFIAGFLAISAKMVLGREGPTIQMGGNLGEMLGAWFKVVRKRRDTLIAAGAGAGLATAFNAPLAGVLFVIEEMREEFNFSFINFKIVAICSVMATITLHFIMGAKPSIEMSVFTKAPGLGSLWMFLVFGVLVGFVGLLFNKVLVGGLYLTDKFKPWQIVIYVLSVGGLVGAFAKLYPEAVGGGYEIIHEALTMMPSLSVLCVLLVLRFITTMLCYTTGVPGGIFAPMLALGTLLGLACSYVFSWLSIDPSIHPGMFAVAGMGALFSAAVRAPATGIVLVIEMTQNYSLILPLMVSCLSATTVVQLAGNPPVYAQLLRRTLKKEELAIKEKRAHMVTGE